jgi:hypothetical protein
METLIQESHTRQELLDNTVNHYNLKNRCTNDLDDCYYRYQGNACAIGRELPDELANHLERNHAGHTVTDDEIFDQLPKRLQDMGKPFLSNVQSLHDGSFFWNENGLNKKGIIKLNYICKIYDLENPLEK